MVQFELKYKDNVVSKWEPYYLDYGKLKKELKIRVKWLERQKGRPLSTLSIATAALANAALTAEEEAASIVESASTDLDTAPSERSGLLASLAPFRSPYYGKDGKALPLVPPGPPFIELVKGEIDKVERFYLKEVISLNERLDFHTLEEELELGQIRRLSYASAEPDEGDEDDLDTSGGSSGGGGNGFSMRYRRLPRPDTGLLPSPRTASSPRGGGIALFNRTRSSSATEAFGGDSTGSNNSSDIKFLSHKDRAYSSSSRLIKPPQSRKKDGVGGRIRRALRRVSSQHDVMLDGDPDHDSKEADSLRRAISDIYRDMNLLKNFCAINYTACVKIIKKHDKQMASLREELGAKEKEEGGGGVDAAADGGVTSSAKQRGHKQFSSSGGSGGGSGGTPSVRLKAHKKMDSGGSSTSHQGGSSVGGGSSSTTGTGGGHVSSNSGGGGGGEGGSSSSSGGVVDEAGGGGAGGGAAAVAASGGGGAAGGGAAAASASSEKERRRSTTDASSVTTEGGGGGSLGHVRTASEKERRHSTTSEKRNSITDSRRGSLVETLSPMLEKITPQIVEYMKHKQFSSFKSLEALMTTCEERFAYAFCGGDMAMARGMLLPQKSDEIQDYSAMVLGYRMGMAAVLFIWLSWDCVAQSYITRTDQSIFALPAFSVYRALGGILLLQWAWGISTLYWSRARINYIYLFELDPRWTGAPVEIFNGISHETNLFAVNMLIYVKSEAHRFPYIVPPGAYPLMLTLYFFFQKTIGFCFEKRDLWRALMRMFRTPFLKVDFYVSYVADVLTSSVKTCQDICWTIMFFASGDYLMNKEVFAVEGARWAESYWYKSVLIPTVCVFPLALRALQCLRRYYDTGKRLPNLLNTLKYAMSMTVSIFGTISPARDSLTIYRTVWIVLYVTSSLYSFAWDVKMDWGLGDRKHGWLSARRMLARKWPYRAAIAMDLVLRFNWMASFIPPALNQGLLPVAFPAYLSSVIILLEFFRRTVWGFFRLEHEHLGNTEGYRRVTFVPLHFTTATDRAYSRDLGSSTSMVWEISIVVGALVIVTLLSIMAAQADQNRAIGPP